MGGTVRSYSKSDDQSSYYRRYIRAVRGDEMPASVFTDNGDDTITDRITGLMWLKEASAGVMTWDAALTYCETLTFPSENGYSDWRLPDINELLTLSDHSKNSLHEFFSGSASHWSSTTRSEKEKGHAWRTYSTGIVIYSSKSTTDYVRAVRDAKVYDFGDIDHSDAIDLGDAVLALKVSAGLPLGDDVVIYTDADVNGDGRIGVEEVIYALQAVAETK